MKHLLPLLSLLCVLCSSTHADDPKPNVILILSDDQGFTDYGFMGHKVVQTPNLDRMAAQSLLYTRGYVMPVCSPTLACLLTGKLPHAHGITGNDLSESAAAAAKTAGEAGRSPLAHKLLSNAMILPKVLTEAGYLTFQTGKLWNVTAEEVGFTSGMTNKEGRHGGDGLDIGRKTMKPIFDFIDKAQSEKKPFFVWYAPMMPHNPHNPPQELMAYYESKGLGKKGAAYYAMCEWFDQTCGELDNYLNQKNLAENTVIIYMADNGWEHGNRGKLTPYEMGIRTPMFVRWPGKVAAKRDEETLASVIDFAPTVLKICGVKVPSELPGVDLLDHAAMTARKSVFVESYHHEIFDLDHPDRSLVTQVVISGWSKLHIPGTIRPTFGHTSAPESTELYDLKSDPLEKKDLAAERTEEVTRLKTLQKAEWSY